MTSGSFHSIPVESIIVNREERQRRDIINVPELAESINRIGLVHPIVVTRDLLLVAGERRLEAVRSLGHTSINAQYVDELDPLILKSIELEENIKRVDISWPDRCRAIGEFHSIRRSEDLEWTQDKTAESLGLDPRYVGRILLVSRELNAGNEKVVAAPKLSTAIGIVERAESRKDESALAELHEIAAIKADEPPADAILIADFNEWASTYTGPRFNFIHCDFPYGIGADKRKQGQSVELHGGYEDDEETYWNLCTALCSNIDRLATESCHIMFWFSMHFYASTLNFFERNSDFRLDNFPLVWLKSDNIGLLPDPERGPRRIYETCFFGSRGDRKITSAVSNAYAAPTDRQFHMSAKPEPVLRHFFRMFVDENSLVLDPTCGSGSALRAAESLNARYVLGLERNEEFADQANAALNKARRLRRAT